MSERNRMIERKIMSERKRKIMSERKRSEKKKNE